jgi:dTDP-4-dehydrorhamnose reductase
LAKCINQYIEQPTVAGVYHLVSNHNQISKFDLLCKINEVFELGKHIVQTQGPKTVNKVLVDTREEIDFGIPNYDSMLLELKNYAIGKL